MSLRHRNSNTHFYAIENLKLKRNFLQKKSKAYIYAIRNTKVYLYGIGILNTDFTLYIGQLDIKSLIKCLSSLCMCVIRYYAFSVGSRGSRNLIKCNNNVTYCHCFSGF